MTWLNSTTDPRNYYN